MGNCRSSSRAATAGAASDGATTASSSSGDHAKKKPFSAVTVNGVAANVNGLGMGGDGRDSDSDEDHHTDTTAALVHALIPVTLPVVRRALCQKLVADGFVLRDEEPVLSLGDDRRQFSIVGGRVSAAGGPSDAPEDLPLGPIGVHMDSLRVVDASSVLGDMDAAPDFDWPERGRAEDLMRMRPGVGVGMVVLDMIGFEGEVTFGRGVELAFPVEGPMGIKCNIEVGTGGKIRDARVKIRVPKLRVWYVNETHALYVAFMEKPDIIPHLHVNLDRGNGDFADMTFTEAGALDDVVEKVLAGFGPDLRQGQSSQDGSSSDDDDDDDSDTKDNGDSSDDNEEDKQGSNWMTMMRKKKRKRRKRLTPFSKMWVADSIGTKIAESIRTSTGMGGGRPLVVDLTEQIDNAVNMALGRPRPEEQIRADMKLLERELELSLSQRGDFNERRGKADKRAKKKEEEEKEKKNVRRGAEEKDGSQGKGANATVFGCEAFEPLYRCLQC